MQRRKVDFPEPDGPTRTSTWPVGTSRVIPLSTLSAPKSLQTLSALAIAVMGATLLSSSSGAMLRGNTLRLGQRLKLFGRQLSACAARVVPLQVELADHHDAGDRQVPGRRDQQQWDGLELAR